LLARSFFRAPESAQINQTELCQLKTFCLSSE
jgi:hypothetical protein